MTVSRAGVEALEIRMSGVESPDGRGMVVEGVEAAMFRKGPESAK